jgi:hypothetical protein
MLTQLFYSSDTLIFASIGSWQLPLELRLYRSIYPPNRTFTICVQT